ncbi:MAG: hypothetical protein M9925_03565 [Chloroflexi bacterium]|nr:hypothetical protein [Chloroflexota bacterium]
MTLTAPAAAGPYSGIVKLTAEGCCESIWNPQDEYTPAEPKVLLAVQGDVVHKAQYKGVGTISGTGNYGFLLTAYEGANTGDKFRIKTGTRTTAMPRSTTTRSARQTVSTPLIRKRLAAAASSSTCPRSSSSHG